MVKIAFIFTSLSIVHTIFTVIYSSLNRFIWNQHSDQLPVGLLALLVEHCFGITDAGLNFFSHLIFTASQVAFLNAKSTFIFVKLASGQEGQYLQQTSPLSTVRSKKLLPSYYFLRSSWQFTGVEGQIRKPGFH